MIPDSGFRVLGLPPVTNKCFSVRISLHDFTKKKDDLCCPSTESAKVQIKFRYLSCHFSAIIILTSKFFLGKTGNIGEDRRHIYLFGQPLTKFNYSTCEVKLTAAGPLGRGGPWAAGLLLAKPLRRVQKFDPSTFSSCFICEFSLFQWF